jgi:hypothetical protein
MTTMEKLVMEYEKLTNSIDRFPHSILVSTNAYNAMIAGSKEIIEGLERYKLYHGLAIRGIEGIKDNCVEVYDQFGKLMETKQFYQFSKEKVEIKTTPNGEFTIIPH